MKRIVNLSIIIALSITLIAQCSCRGEETVQEEDFSYYVVVTEDQIIAYDEPGAVTYSKAYFSNGQCVVAKPTPENADTEWLPVYDSPAVNIFWIKRSNVQESPECKASYTLFSDMFKSIKPLIERGGEFDFHEPGTYARFTEALKSEMKMWIDEHISESVESVTNSVNSYQDSNGEYVYDEVVKNETLSLDESGERYVYFIDNLLFESYCLSPNKNRLQQTDCLNPLSLYLTFWNLTAKDGIIAFNHGSCSCHQSWWYFRQENKKWKAFRVEQSSY